MKFLSDHKGELKNKTALLRLDLNLNTDTDFTSSKRFISAILSIKEAMEVFDGISVISHMSGGRSLQEVLFELKKEFPEMEFVPKKDCFERRGEGVYLLENLRQFEGEIKNDKQFAKQLSSLADVFVQDAFGVLHREHASVVYLPKFMPAYAGCIVRSELEHLNRALHPNGKSVFVLGGAKFDTKLGLLKKMSGIYNTVIVTGALANDWLKSRGVFVGESKVSDIVLQDDVLGLQNIVLPYKYIALDKLTGATRITNGLDLKDKEMIVDAFVRSEAVADADFLLWNGPFGWYEEGFKDGTCDFLSHINKDAVKFAGGGDSDAMLNICVASDLFDFVSTGGGAMLKYLADETLPGIEALG